MINDTSACIDSIRFKQIHNTQHSLKILLHLIFMNVSPIMAMLLRHLNNSTMATQYQSMKKQAKR